MNRYLKHVWKYWEISKKGILSGGFKYILNVYPKDWGRLPSWWAYSSDWVSTTSYVYTEYILELNFLFRQFLLRISWLLCQAFVHVSFTCWTHILANLTTAIFLVSCFETINWYYLDPQTQLFTLTYRISCSYFMLEKNQGIPTRAWKPSARNGHLNRDLLVMIPPSRETTKMTRGVTCAAVCLLLGTSLATNKKDKHGWFAFYEKHS